MKKCGKCKIEKPLDAFYGKKSRCAECHKQDMKEYRQRNPDVIRKTNLKRCYNITTEQYEEMREQQAGSCWICGKHESTEHYKKLAVDHCHTTGKVRGLLCKGCNHGLGNFNDNPKLLEKAMEYLKENV
jgi:NAD(P)H-flavin reductase